MKLIDLLVKELPKRGGWPNDAKQAWQSSSDGEVYFDGFNDDRVRYRPELIYLPVSDNAYDRIQRCEYESALAASQQQAWSGEGLPPVGCDVEFILDTEKYSVNGNIPENGQAVNVVAHKVTTDDNPVAVVYWDDNGSGRAAAFIKQAFRPIRTEAERKRDAFIRVMQDEDLIGAYITNDEAGFIYDAISAGKIPGVKLE